MSVRTRVVEDFVSGRVKVYLIDDEAGLIFGSSQVYRRSEVPAGTSLPEDAAALVLSEQWLRPIVAALNEHISGDKAPGDAYALRRDLDREHGRVDKLLDFAVEMGRRVGGAA